MVVQSGIQTWDLSVCVYLKLKRGDLDHSATMACCIIHIFDNDIFTTLNIVSYIIQIKEIL